MDNLTTVEGLLAGAKVVDQAGTQRSVADLSGKLVGLYFSAHWCGPCRQFTPILSKVYEEVRAAGKDL